MTGEMGWKDLKDYPEMQELTKMLRQKAGVAAQLRPFDQYQGPYIAVNTSGSPSMKDLGMFDSKVWQAGCQTSSMSWLYVIEHGPSNFTKAMTGPQIVAYFIRKAAPYQRKNIRQHMKKTPQRGGKRCKGR